MTPICSARWTSKPSHQRELGTCNQRQRFSQGGDVDVASIDRVKSGTLKLVRRECQPISDCTGGQCCLLGTSPGVPALVLDGRRDLHGYLDT